MKLHLRTRPVDGLILGRVAGLPDLYVAAADEASAHQQLLDLIREHVAARPAAAPPTPVRLAPSTCLACQEDEHDACMGPCDCTVGYHTMVVR